MASPIFLCGNSGIGEALHLIRDPENLEWQVGSLIPMR
jgi:hypothetical protein